MVEDPRSLFSKFRGKMVADAAKATRRQKSEVYEYCIRYWQRGQIAGCIAPLYTQASDKGQEPADASQEPKAVAKKRGPKAKIVAGEMSLHTQISVGVEEEKQLLQGVKQFRLRKIIL